MSALVRRGLGMVVAAVVGGLARLALVYRAPGPPAVRTGIALGFLVASGAVLGLVPGGWPRRVALGGRHVNRLRDHPEWYSALTHNCTTAIRGHAEPPGARSWTSWKLLANGHPDELAYEIGAVDRSRPFPELRARSRINEVARAAGDAPDLA